MSMFNVNIYIKNKTKLLNELYFGFCQTFEVFEGLAETEI